MKHNLR